MRTIGEISELTTTQAALARYLGLSKPRVNQLVDEEIVIRSNDNGIKLADSIRNYYLNSGGARQAEQTENTYYEERRLHEKAKRELAELKLAKARGKVYDAELVEKTIVTLLANLRANLLNLANLLPSSLVGCDENAINEILTANIEYALEELSKFDTSVFNPEDDDE